MYEVILDRLESINKNAKLIAVSKQQPLDRVQLLLDQGHRVFGENRVQEASSKWPKFQEYYSNIELHLLGPLQTNKVKQAFTLFEYIHSVDRIKLVDKIAGEAQLKGFSPQLFIQVNIGEETQKAGVSIGDLNALIERSYTLDLPIIGLMCIPPAGIDPRKYFQKLKQLNHEYGLKCLSMGMSADWEIAIDEGATHIRVGSAIFGKRNTPANTL